LVVLRVLALLAGIAGVAGFFLPLVQYRDTSGKLTQTATPYEIATTEHDTSGVAEVARSLGASEEQAEQIAEAAENSLLAYRGAIIAFYAPAGLLALVALIDVLRGRMGRIAGFITLVLGAANLAVFGYFYIAYARHADAQGHATIGYGIWLLAGAGGLGALAGLIAVFAPEGD
jgi:hypothetical protein